MVRVEPEGLRLLHLVTLVGEKGAFGGPLRVALNQLSGFASQGHEVRLMAGTDGDPSVSVIEGVPVGLHQVFRVVPRSGFTGLAAPSLLAAVWRTAKYYDVVHVHAGRDLISLMNMQLLAWLRVPYITQTHGMIAPDPRLAVKLLDWLTVRRLLRRAQFNLVLNFAEEQALTTVKGTSVGLIRLPNGVPRQPRRYDLASEEVLFCARLHPRKRPEAFAEMASLLSRDGVEADFIIIGPDEGCLPNLLVLQAEGSPIRYEGALEYQDVLERLERVAVYVLPSQNEPYPMSLLEAMSLGIPSVTTDSLGITAELRASGGAVITDGTPRALADAVKALLQDVRARDAASLAAHEAVERHFGMAPVIERLQDLYRLLVRRRSAV